MRLTVALLFGAVGYTLIYAGIKGGPKGQWARQPWLLWTQAFAELNKEVVAAQNQAAKAATLRIGGPAPTTPALV